MGAGRTAGYYRAPDCAEDDHGQLRIDRGRYRTVDGREDKIDDLVLNMAVEAGSASCMPVHRFAGQCRPPPFFIPEKDAGNITSGK